MYYRITKMIAQLYLLFHFWCLLNL
jgi:hypothetical protein